MAALTDRETKHSLHSEPSSDADRPRSNGGTMPPTPEREVRASDTSSGLPLFKANPALSPGVRAVEPPDGTRLNAKDGDALPPEADGANPLTLGPSDPMRESAEGQPYLDDANPYGRTLVNRQNRPMGGVGTLVDPKDEERPCDRTETPPSERLTHER